MASRTPTSLQVKANASLHLSPLPASPCNRFASACSPSVACPHSHHPTPPAVSSVMQIPVPTSCPKCSLPIELGIAMCPHCSFDVAGYQENLRDAKCIIMTPKRFGTKSREAVLAKFDPPCDEALTEEEQDERTENLRRALRDMKHTYQAVVCPNCKHKARTQVFGGFAEWYDCPRCSKRSLRKSRLLFYIPKPDALTSSDLDVFLRRWAIVRGFTEWDEPL